MDKILSSLSEEIILLDKFLHRNRNQHRKQKSYQNMMKIRRTFKCCGIQVITDFIEQLNKTLLSTQQKISRHIVTSVVVAIEDCFRILMQLIEVCISCEHAGIHLLMQVRNGLFAALYSVFLATVSRIMHMTSSIIIHIYDHTTTLIHHIEHVMVVRPQYVELVDQYKLKIVNMLPANHVIWMQKLKNASSSYDNTVITIPSSSSSLPDTISMRVDDDKHMDVTTITSISMNADADTSVVLEDIAFIQDNAIIEPIISHDTSSQHEHIKHDGHVKNKNKKLRLSKDTDDIDDIFHGI